MTLMGLTLNEWQDLYASGTDVDHTLHTLLEQLSVTDPAWISLSTPEQLSSQIQQLSQRLTELNHNAELLPLYGIPFAVKDNIDVAGFVTTAACPAFAYTAEHDATVIHLLKQAGAIVIGKTNLDQFATGLVGTRSPYGEVPNAFKPEYVSGGSSSGSASVVARGLVPFALGTDTAGSGRVPAGFNNIVGLKPTRGAISTTGLVPACRSLDCISIFALSVADAETVFQLVQQFDTTDAYSRHANISTPRHLPASPVFGIPSKINWFSDKQAQTAFEQNLTSLSALGVQFKPIDFSSLFELAALLYEGPWVAERMAAIESLFVSQSQSIDPIVRDIIAKADQFSATDGFKAEYQRMALLRKAQAIMAEVDALCVPTTPTIYTRAEIAEAPIQRNSHFGLFTNFVNFADWSALAIPGHFREDGLPAGFTLIAPAWHDVALAEFGQRWQTHFQTTRGALELPLSPSPVSTPSPASGWIRLAVVGAHLSGMPLNSQLTERHAYFVETTRTAADYQFFALANTMPAKPGLQRVSPNQGSQIEVELWDMPLTEFGSFVSLIPAPLGIGTVTLADGRTVKGFICEAIALNDALDITASGGWRHYLSHANA